MLVLMTLCRSLSEVSTVVSQIRFFALVRILSCIVKVGEDLNCEPTLTGARLVSLLLHLVRSGRWLGGSPSSNLLPAVMMTTTTIIRGAARVAILLLLYHLLNQNLLMLLLLGFHHLFSGHGHVLLHHRIDACLQEVMVAPTFAGNIPLNPGRVLDVVFLRHHHRIRHVCVHNRELSLNSLQHAGSWIVS